MQISAFERKGKGISKTEPAKAVEAEIDMYADDFDERVKEQKNRREEEAAATEAESKRKKEEGGYTKGKYFFI